MSALENPFDAPIPGQSLTDTPGNYPWEHPSQFSDVEEASEYVWDRLHSEEMLDQVITLLKEGVPVEALTRMVLFGGFAESGCSSFIIRNNFKTNYGYRCKSRST